MVAERSSQRRLLLPDERIAAGDLASHIVMRHRDMQGGRLPATQSTINAASGEFAAPDGSIFIFSPWARAFVDDIAPTTSTEGSTRGGCHGQVSPLLFEVS